MGAPLIADVAVWYLLMFVRVDLVERAQNEMSLHKHSSFSSRSPHSPESTAYSVLIGASRVDLSKQMLALPSGGIDPGAPSQAH